MCALNRQASLTAGTIHLGNAGTHGTLHGTRHEHLDGMQVLGLYDVSAPFARCACKPSVKPVCGAPFTVCGAVESPPSSIQVWCLVVNL